MDVTFISLSTQYDSLNHNEKVFFASTPCGPQFLSRNLFFRFIDTFFRNYSYNLADSTADLIDKATNLLAFPEACSEAELMSAIKVMKIAQGILIHALETSFDVTNYHSRKFARGEIKKTIEALSSALAKKQGSSTIEILFKYGCTSELFDVLKKEPLSAQIDPIVLEPILQFACEQSATEIALILIQHNVSTKNLNTIEPAYIALLAHEANARSNDVALSFLVDEQESVGNSEVIYLEAVKKGLFSTIKRFIEKKKIHPDFTDGENNTALHYAFNKGDIKLVRFLLEHCDPLAKNKFGLTPLQSLLDPQGTLSKECKLPPSQTKAFLEAFFDRSRNECPEVFLDHLDRLVERTIPGDATCDGIELCFLLQKPLLIISPHVPREDFETTMPYLKKKYPKANIDEFFLSSFALNLDHLKTGCEQHPVAKQVPNNTPLEKLYALFDSIPWDKVDESKFYQEVFERSFFTGDIKTLLRDELDTLVRKIRGRAVFAGTPSGEQALEDFYAQTELCLRHSAARLERIKDPELTLSFFKEILRATKHCGGRYFQTATSQYLRICHEVEELPRGVFERLLANYRRICFEGVVGSLYNGYANAFTQATRDLGKELGLPGAENTFDDPYTVLGYSKSDIRKTFFENAYTPYSIIFYHLFPSLEQDNAAQEAYIDLQKEAMPATWDNEKHKKIFDELAAIPVTIKGQERTKAENTILAKYEIARSRPHQSAAEAIEESRRVDFLNAFVYDADKKRTLSGMLFLLERLEIFTSLFTWKDPSRKIAPLPHQGAFRKIPLVGATLTGIGSFFKSLFSYWNR